ncbi:MAG: hypothetical protein IH960_08435 [Chloroflexi bacterium]|nr:hypothetical protein [Chloroflexota bacterium]
MTDRFRGRGMEVTRNDWDNYGDYDLILFMGYDSKVREAKKANPRAIVGLMMVYLFEDWQRAEAAAADVLFADSIEMRERLLETNKNVFIYYMFPVMDDRATPGKGHNDRIIIGYHGSRTHMVQAHALVRALDRLAQNYDIELWAIYNIGLVGRWEKNHPKKCPVRHIQWSDENIYEYLSQCDMGVAPGTIPINRSRGLKASRFVSTYRKNWLYYSHTDNLIRFKLPTNPSRLYPFSHLRVPVVAEFVPSFCQFIQDGVSGHLVSGEDGWYRGLESLILDPDSRNSMSDALKRYVDANHTPQMIFERFLLYVDDVKERRRRSAQDVGQAVPLE